MEKEKTVEEMMQELLLLQEQVKTLTAENGALSTEVKTLNKTVGETRELNQKLFLKVSQSQPEPETTVVDPDQLLEETINKLLSK